MQHRTTKHLLDMQSAAGFVAEITAGKSEAEYVSDRLLRSAVERQFEIIGEALNRIGKEDDECFKGFSSGPQIVSFRNMLIHGYDTVRDVRVWQIIKTDLPILLLEINALLQPPSPEAHE